MQVLYLDAYHSGDPIFIQRLGRIIARLGRGGRRFALVHNPIDELSRVLGPISENSHEIMASSEPRLQERMERSVRESNRRLAAQLTELEVPAVDLPGSGLGLLSVKRGQIVCGSSGWVRDLVRQGVIPVVSPLANRDDSVVWAPPAAVAAAIAGLFGPADAEVVVFHRGDLPAGAVTRFPMTSSPIDPCRLEGVVVDLVEITALTGVVNVVFATLSDLEHGVRSE